MLGRMLLDGLLNIGGSRQKEQLAVCENTIHVEQQQLDFLGSRAGIWHARILAEQDRKAASGVRPQASGDRPPLSSRITGNILRVQALKAEAKSGSLKPDA